MEESLLLSRARCVLYDGRPRHFLGVRSELFDGSEKISVYEEFGGIVGGWGSGRQQFPL